MLQNILFWLFFSFPDETHCTVDTKTIVKGGVCVRETHIGAVNMRAEYACNLIHDFQAFRLGKRRIGTQKNSIDIVPAFGILP